MAVKLAQRDNGGAPAARLLRRISIRCDKWRAGQHGANNPALHSNAAPVNDSDIFQPQAARFFQISFDNSFHFLRLHRVEVKNVCDGNAKGLVVRRHGASAPILTRGHRCPGADEASRAFDISGQIAGCSAVPLEKTI